VPLQDGGDLASGHNLVGYCCFRCQMREQSRDSVARADVQIWVVATGSGHRRVAEAVRAALLEQSRGELRVAIDDPLATGALPHARWLLLSYGPLVRTSPGLWGMLFRIFARPLARRSLEEFLLTGLGRSMERLSRQRQPRVVVSCHPLLGPGAMRAASAVARPAPLVTVVTDLTVVHPGWLSPASATFLTPSAVASEWCRSQGIANDQIFETGLPIDPRIGELAALPDARAARRRELGLDPDRLCVLVGGGGEGAGDLRPGLMALASSGLPLQLVVLCGRNKGLLGWIRTLPKGAPIFPLPFTDDASSWLLSADAYVGKAGPSTLAEAAAAGLAILVTDALPGQERANEALLVEAGAAVSIGDATELVWVVRRLCDPADPLLGSLQAGAKRWARPSAAQLAASKIASLL
jgi:UDP-N-acetylglucosamine:LPS N-acetylglucosamine transferase